MNKLEISSSRSNKQIPGLAEFVSCLFVLDAVTGREGTALLLLVWSFGLTKWNGAWLDDYREVR